MFEAIHKHRKLIQIIIGLIVIPPFVFVGVSDYIRNRSGGQAVAEVGGREISQQEFSRALQERRDAILRLTGGRADPQLLDSAELRFNVAEALIRQRLLLDRAQRSGMIITDQQLQNVIAELPAFQSGGKFSFELYQQYLRSQGLTPAGFEAKLRQDLVLQQLDDAFGESSFVPRSVVERLARLSEQRREISTYRFSAEDYLSQVRLEPDAVKKYYESNPDEFRLPERVRVEYVTLTVDSILSDISVDPAEVKKLYEERRTQYEAREERQASHILIAVEPGAGAEAKEKARARAEEIYREVRQRPQGFADLARKYSQDPGSAAKGGDLGYFGRGVMPRAFEDAVFGLKVGEISPPVETQYGYHIIRLMAVKSGQGRSFEDVRTELEQELKRQRAGRQFAAIAENFNNVVFEQFDSLKPAAQLAKSPIRESGWLTREHAEEPRLNHPKLLQAIFTEDVLKNKRNTEAVEVEPGVLVAARVIEHEPSRMRPFDEVSAAIVKKITMAKAVQLAAQEGRERLEKLRQGGEVRVAWSEPKLVSRAEPAGLSVAVLGQAFRLSADKLPAYGGVDEAGGYTLVRVTRVIDPDKVAPERLKAVAETLRQLQGQEAMLAYVASLRKSASVRVSRELVERKDQ